MQIPTSLFLTITTVFLNFTHAAVNWNGNNWAMRCDFSGHDLGNVVIASSQCGGKCASTSGCTHFTWTQWNGGTCWMKSGAVSPNDAFETNDPNMVCGYMQNSGGGGGGGQSGVTTRYWDCCKPSCSWGDKAPVTNPVRSCAKNGVDPLGSNVQSICEGGTAHTCNSQVPFVQNNVAYGFAAARITGSNERGWCCACYELTFTSSTVSGQKMIVQVTNTGADLGSNHFDLQIPGGGVGYYNGCQSQWNAPADGWGNRRNGGVYSEQECEQIPNNELKAGCKWRFGWFKNADNPNINFRPVTCPAVLTQKSGCTRTA